MLRKKGEKLQSNIDPLGAEEGIAVARKEWPAYYEKQGAEALRHE